MRYRENEGKPLRSARFAYAQNFVRSFYAFSLINRTGLEFDRCLTKTYMSDALIARSRRLPRVPRIYDRVERQMFALSFEDARRDVYLRHGSFVNQRRTPLRDILHFLRIERQSHI